MMEKYWEHFNHSSDIGIRGHGTTKEEAFEQAGLALTAVLVEPMMVNEHSSIKIICEALDEELLFNEWLNTIVYEMAVKKMVFARYEVKLRGLLLDGQLWGETIDPIRHQPKVEVKGATMTELKVNKMKAGNWITQCVLDV